MNRRPAEPKCNRFRAAFTAVGVMASLAMGLWSAAYAAETIAPGAFHESRQFADTPQGRISYIERGTGPAALFIHAANLNGYQWRHQVASLSDIRRCIALDTLGMGHTEPNAGQSLSLAAQAEMINSFLDALAIDTVDLVGSDSGGAIAQIFAANHPDRIRSLTLTNCEVHEFDNDNPAIEELKNLVASDGLIPLVRTAAKNPDMARMALATTYEDPKMVAEETLEIYLAPLASSEERLMLMNRYFLEMNSADLMAVEPKLRRLNVPVLILWGTGDPFFPVSCARWLEATLPDVREVMLIEGGKVLFCEERPETTNKKLREFWVSIWDR